MIPSQEELFLSGVPGYDKLKNTFFHVKLPESAFITEASMAIRGVPISGVEEVDKDYLNRTRLVYITPLTIIEHYMDDVPIRIPYQKEMKQLLEILDEYLEMAMTRLKTTIHPVTTPKDFLTAMEEFVTGLNNAIDSGQLDPVVNDFVTKNLMAGNNEYIQTLLNPLGMRNLSLDEAEKKLEEKDKPKAESSISNYLRQRAAQNPFNFNNLSKSGKNND